MEGGTIQLALLMILSVVIAALVSALTALGVSYPRTRGQNLATKHDFDELQKQLSATTTKLVETRLGVVTASPGLSFLVDAARPRRLPRWRHLDWREIGIGG